MPQYKWRRNSIHLSNRIGGFFLVSEVLEVELESRCQEWRGTRGVDAKQYDRRQRE